MPQAKMKGLRKPCARQERHAQAQEICDRVGILANGILVREGHLRELIAIENQTELVLETDGRVCFACKLTFS